MDVLVLFTSFVNSIRGYLEHTVVTIRLDPRRKRSKFCQAVSVSILIVSA